MKIASIGICFPMFVSKDNTCHLLELESFQLFRIAASKIEIATFERDKAYLQVDSITSLMIELSETYIVYISLIFKSWYSKIATYLSK